MIIRKLVTEICLVRSYVFYHIVVYISMEKSDQAHSKLNLLTIITFDRSDWFQSDNVHFKAEILL